MSTNLRQRDAWLDNAKGILMILVVMGHTTASIAGMYPSITCLYNGINFFHMGTFMMVSGFLCQRRIERRDWVSVINRNIVPYLVAQALMFAAASLFEKGFRAAASANTFAPGTFTFLRPMYQLWYLVAIILFNFVCIAIQPKRHPVITMIVALAVAMLVPLAQQIGILRLSKAAGFFPFFLLGAIIPPEGVQFLRRKRALMIPAAVIFAAYIVWICFTVDKAPAAIGSLSHSYKSYGADYPALDPVLMRAIFYPAVALLGICFVSLMPRRRTFFTYLGEKSLYIYVLHGIVIIIFRVINYETRFLRTLTEPWMRLCLLAGCILVTFLLASPPVVKVFRPLLEPNFDLRRIVGKLCDEYHERQQKSE